MTDATVAFGSFRLNPGRRELTREGKRVALGCRALEILCLLAAADGEPVSKSELLARLWPGAVAGENNLHVHISVLRQQLGESGRTHLVTVPGYGYRLLASAIPPTRRVGASPPERPTLGVLAFRNISGETRYEAFTEGLTDGVVTQLARTRSLIVVAGTDAASGKIDVRRIGRQLGVHYILDGTTRCDAESAHVNARLIDARTGAHLWAQSYRRDLDEPYRAQDALANALAAAMDVVVTGLECGF
jgi:TolB-like protein